MLFVIFFTIACLLGLGISLGLAINNCIDKQKEKFKKKIVWILLFAALTFASVLTMYHGTTDYVGDGKKVALVYDEAYEKSYPIYYSEEHDEYFVVFTNLYNPFNLSDRYVIDKKAAEQYVALYNEINSIDLKGKMK